MMPMFGLDSSNQQLLVQLAIYKHIQKVWKQRATIGVGASLAHTLNILLLVFLQFSA